MARGPADESKLINEALSKLHFPNQEFLIRAYLHYIGNGKFDIFTHYEHFSLRDANSNNPNFFYQFGILRDD